MLQKESKLLLATIFIAVGTVSVLGVLPVGGAQNQPSDYAIVLLRDQPLSSYQGTIHGLGATMPVAGGRLNIESPAALAYAGYLANQHALARSAIAGAASQVQILYDYYNVLNGFAVKLNGYSLPRLLGVGGIVGVTYSYSLHYDMNRSNALIGSSTLWGADGGQSNAGAGMKIGIIDTGIDFTHPFLTDNRLTVPAGYPKCDALDSAVGKANTSCKYVSNKVIVAKMFCTQPVCVAFDAQAKQDHGSHVSGIAAGVANTCAPFVGCTMSGVAPKAFLGNYNVFPGNVTDASSIDIAAAVDAAVADGMNVLNLSLGGTPVPNDPLVTAVDNAVDAGVIVAIAAGNAGPGTGTIESPGIADKVITVGASTNPHFVGIPVTVPGLGTFGAALGQFSNYGVVSNAPYSTTTPTNGCTAITNKVAGQIALIARGTCTFSTKIRNAQNAGATGALIYNNVAGDPIAMGQDGTPKQPTIPAAMVSQTNGLAMASAPTKTVSIDGTMPQEFFTDGPSADILAGFSSRGPAMIGNRILTEVKPDVVAPGVNVYSSILMTSCSTPPCFAFFQGTSMATPHVAGAAALLKQLHPNWSPLQIKSALENTAKRPVGSSTNNAPLTNPMFQGGGRINLASVTQITATINAANSANLGYGRLSVTEDVGTVPLPVTVQSVTGAPTTYTVTVSPAVDGPNAPSVATSKTTITVSGGGTAKFVVSLTVASSTAPGDYYGDITLTGGTVTLRIPYWVEIAP
jgi:minor extracellular serine protease Vpr